MNDNFSKAVENIKLRMRDFTPADSGAHDLVWEQEVDKSSVEREQFPVPSHDHPQSGWLEESP